MWSKIRFRKIPISIKLTFFYAGILFCILLFTSILTIAGLRYYFNIREAKELEISVKNVKHYLAAGNRVDQRILDLLVPGVMLKMIDSQGRLVFDSYAYLPGIRMKDEEEHGGDHRRHGIAPRIPADENHSVRWLTWHDDRTYTLQLIRKTSLTEARFLNVLIVILTGTNLIGLLIAVFSGMTISRRILRPVRDITDTAKKIEISNLGQRLNVSGSEDELQELAKTFNHMLNRIQSGVEQQQRFVADASHELRTPIMVISGYAAMLDRWGKQDAPALDEGIAAIKSEAANMQGLIEKLLFLARTDQGRQVIKKAPLDIARLIKEVVQETRLIAPSHQVALIRNDPATILADASAIKQMLRIFIENSIKYTPANGTISFATHRTGDCLEVTIQDTGIGIPAADQSKIFDRFYRVDKSRTKGTGGTGLGLSIASWIAEQHGSAIYLKSTYGEGTAITVQFPLIQANIQNSV